MKEAKESVRIGACALLIEKEEKRQPVYYDKLFALCDGVLPGCGCDVVLLPERYGYRASEEGPLDGPVGARFSDLAQRHGLYLIAPIAERVGDEVYNTQVVYTPDREILFRYRKVQLTPEEKHTTAPGNELDVFDLPWFRAGIVICYDNQFPETTRCLAVRGAQVIFFPSYGNERKPIQHTARCLDNHVYMIGAGVIDRDCGLPDDAFEGGMVIDPEGNTLAESPTEEGMITAELPLDSETGRLGLPKREHSYLEMRRPECFGVLCQPAADWSGDVQKARSS